MQKKVREFHAKFGSTINDVPTIPSPEDMALRIELIREEFLELRDGIAARDIVEIADALGDLLYVVLGAGVTFGLDMESIFNEIHSSNMSKVFPDGSVHHREDGKVLKPDTFRHPNIKGVIGI